MMLQSTEGRLDHEEIRKGALRHLSLAVGEFKPLVSSLRNLRKHRETVRLEW